MATSGKRPTGATLKPVRRYAVEVRFCAVCQERLSTYNPGPNCYAHTTTKPWRGPDTRPRS
jgi:hypothetical protein